MVIVRNPNLAEIESLWGLISINISIKSPEVLYGRPPEGIHQVGHTHCHESRWGSWDSPNHHYCWDDAVLRADRFKNKKI